MEKNYFDENPGLKEIFESMRDNRRDEILNYLKEHDREYGNIIRERAAQSITFQNKIKNEIFEFEKYMDTVYAQQIYELDEFYAQGFKDALAVLKKMGIL